MNNSPCAKLTTSMMPKMSVRPEATSAKIMPLTTPFTVWMISKSTGMLWKKCATRPSLDPRYCLMTDRRP